MKRLSEDEKITFKWLVPEHLPLEHDRRAVKPLNNDIKIYFNGKEAEKGVTQHLSEPKIKLEDIKEIGKYEPHWVLNEKHLNNPPKFEMFYLNDLYKISESEKNACYALYVFENLPNEYQTNQEKIRIAREMGTFIKDMNKHHRCMEQGIKCWEEGE